MESLENDQDIPKRKFYAEAFKLLALEMAPVTLGQPAIAHFKDAVITLQPWKNNSKSFFASVIKCAHGFAHTHL